MNRFPSIGLAIGALSLVFAVQFRTPFMALVLKITMSWFRTQQPTEVRTHRGGCAC